MDRHQAKEILARYRPGESFGDPQVGEALEFARKDPQLAEWFKQRAAQEDGAAVVTKEAPVPLPRERGIKPLPLLIGIVIVLLIGMFAWSLTVPKLQDPFVIYREHMVRVVRRAYPAQVSVNDLAQIKDYFRTNAGPVDFRLPRNLEKLPPKGCAVFTWRSHPVALMSFEAGANTNLSLFMITSAAFPNTSIPLTIDYVRVGKLLTATWTQDNRIYLLTGPDDPALLKNFAESEPVTP